MKKKILIIATVIACLTMALCTLISGSADLSSDPVLLPNGDFETGSVGPWSRVDGGTVSIVSSPEPVYEGNYALKSSERKSGWHGVISGNLADLFNENGAGTYSFSAMMRLGENGSGITAENVIIRLQIVATGSSTWMFILNQPTVTQDRWTNIGAYGEGYRVFCTENGSSAEVNWVGRVTNARLIITTVDDGTPERDYQDFYLDNVAIWKTAELGEFDDEDEGTGEAIADGGFESGKLGKWFAEEANIEVVNSVSHSGDYSLRVYDRISSWGQACIDMTAYFNANGHGKYAMSAFMKMADDADFDNALIRLRLMSSTEGAKWFVIPNQAVIYNNEWTDIGAMGGGGYLYFSDEATRNSDLTWSGTLTSATMFISTAPGGTNKDFYLDDVIVWKVEEQPPTSPPTTSTTSTSFTSEPTDPDTSEPTSETSDVGWTEDTEPYQTEETGEYSETTTESASETTATIQEPNTTHPTKPAGRGGSDNSWQIILLVCIIAIGLAASGVVIFFNVLAKKK